MNGPAKTPLRLALEGAVGDAATRLGMKSAGEISIGEAALRVQLHAAWAAARRALASRDRAQGEMALDRLLAALLAHDARPAVCLPAEETAC